MKDYLELLVHFNGHLIFCTKQSLVLDVTVISDLEIDLNLNIVFIIILII